MEENLITPQLAEKIKLLKEKYAHMGQDLNSYLDGLLVSDYVDYWNYINLDALLNLQHPRTNFPDEKTFIIYHQITELYFRLIRNCIELVADNKNLTADFFISQLRRINNYFRHLTDSFSIMYEGMDKNQFLAFRMALLPASGFQSAQYRMIEICSTDIENLVAINDRGKLKTTDEFLEHLYWKRGATELATGKKTLTLLRFEGKYNDEFKKLTENFKEKNLRVKYHSLSAAEKHNEELKNLLREFDKLANVNWPLVHYRTAARYMERKPEDIAATGGTNWQKYLPPRFQLIYFFPELWSNEEKENWGKTN
jgi:tryptophan 2,3-dioxygenase